MAWFWKHHPILQVYYYRRYLCDNFSITSFTSGWQVLCRRCLECVLYFSFICNFFEIAICNELQRVSCTVARVRYEEIVGLWTWRAWSWSLDRQCYIVHRSRYFCVVLLRIMRPFSEFCKRDKILNHQALLLTTVAKVIIYARLQSWRVSGTGYGWVPRYCTVSFANSRTVHSWETEGLQESLKHIYNYFVSGSVTTCY